MARWELGEAWKAYDAARERCLGLLDYGTEEEFDAALDLETEAQDRLAAIISELTKGEVTVEDANWLIVSRYDLLGQLVDRAYGR